MLARQYGTIEAEPDGLFDDGHQKLGPFVFRSLVDKKLARGGHAVTELRQVGAYYSLPHPFYEIGAELFQARFLEEIHWVTANDVGY